MMRSLGLVFLGVLLIALVAISYFVLTFDLSRYQPLIVDQLTRTLNRQVALRDLSLGWKGGLALRLRGFRVYPGQTTDEEPLFSVDDAHGVLSLASLLHGEVKIRSLVLEAPLLTLVRTQQGQILGFEKKKIPPAPERAKEEPSLPLGKRQKEALPLRVLIQSIQIHNGQILYRDPSLSPVSDLSVSGLDISIEDVAVNRWIPLRASMQLFSTHQNVNMEAQVRLSLPEGIFEVRQAEFEIHLDTLEVNQLQQVLPALEQVRLKGLSGQFEATVPSFVAGPTQLTWEPAIFRWKNGGILFQQPLPSVTDISFEGQATRDEIRVGHLAARYLEGEFLASANIQLKTMPPLLTIEAEMTGVNLAHAVRDHDRGLPHFEGQLSVFAKGTAKGRDITGLQKTLVGDGRLQVRDPILRNRNILNEVFSQLSLIPGLAQNLQRRLPPEYKEKFKSQHTYFRSIDIPFRVQDERLFFQDVRLQSDTFAVVGKGQLGFNGLLSAWPVLVIDAPMSQAIIGIVHEMQYLADPEGQLQIPFTIQGSVRNLRILPDLGYVASQLAITKTRKVVGRLLEKAVGTPKPAGSPPPSGETQTQEPKSKEETSADGLNQILNLFLTPTRQSQQTADQ